MSLDVKAFSNSTLLSSVYGDSSSWWDINDSIVFVTWVIFAGVILSSIVAYLMRPTPKRKNFHEVLAGTSNPILLGTSYQADSSPLYGGKRSPPSNSPTSSEQDKLPVTRNQVSHIPATNEKKYDALVPPSRDIEDNVSEASSLLDNNMGLHNFTASFMAAASSATSTFVPTSSDKTMGDTLRGVLKHGMVITVHTTEGSKSVTMFLVGSELQWRSAHLFSRKTKRLELTSVICVEWGKKTNTFRSKGGASKGVPEDLCFSLVSNAQTVDLEASTKVERDALAQGFNHIISELKRGRV